MAVPGGGAARLEALLRRHWWRERVTWLTMALTPFSLVFASLAALSRAIWKAGLRRPERAPVPVVVIGNIVVGGAGKTPTVVAVVRMLEASGRTPGVVSRGHGRRAAGLVEVLADTRADEVGDEPLLIARRARVPVMVGRRRVEAARALCAAHPEVDVIVADDGLQHLAMARDVEVVVFDGRGVGNGLLLPAGPLREPLAAARGRLVLYNAAGRSTPLPGAIAVRRLGSAVPLASWAAGHGAGALPLASLRGRPLLAAAGIAEPERFFRMLEAEGLAIDRLPLPDHHAYRAIPWPPGTADVLVTEKDAVKLSPAVTGATRVWVVGLDLTLPDDFMFDLLTRLGSARTP